MLHVQILVIVVAPYDHMIAADFNGDTAARPAVVDYGDALTLNCTASGGPANMFRWFKDGVLLQGNDGGVLEISAVNATDGGLYECEVNNTAGNSTVDITIYGESCLLFKQLILAFGGIKIHKFYR